MRRPRHLHGAQEDIGVTLDIVYVICWHWVLLGIGWLSIGGCASKQPEHFSKNSKLMPIQIPFPTHLYFPLANRTHKRRAGG